MSIIRSPRMDRGFTIISNDVAQDDRLSMRALGLLVRLLSRPDNWETNSEKMAREFNVGREQMQGVLRELSKLGYMSLVKTRQQDGTIKSKWHVFDEPVNGSPGAGLPEPGNPYAGKPVAIKQEQIYKEPNTKTPKPPASPGADALFDTFWTAYPVKVGKDAAKRAFAKRKPTAELLGEMLKAIAEQKTSLAWVKEDGQFIPHPATWLNQGRWMDEVPGVPAASFATDPRLGGAI